MTSLTYIEDLKGNHFGRTIYPPSFVVIALTFSERWGPNQPPSPVPKHQKKPSWNRVKKPSQLSSELWTGNLTVLLCILLRFISDQ